MNPMRNGDHGRSEASMHGGQGREGHGGRMGGRISEGPFGRERIHDRDDDRSYGHEARSDGGRRARRWRRGGARARDIMTRNPKGVGPTDGVQRIAQIMVEEDCGIVPVVEQDGRLLGVVTDRDIVCRLIARGVDMKDARARDVMSDDVECVTEEEDLHAVLRLMSEHQIRRIPVVARGDRLVGIIALADLAREADVDEDLQDTFEDISSERSFWSRLR
jgi:CBS domain-containing protein